MTKWDEMNADMNEEMIMINVITYSPFFAQYMVANSICDFQLVCLFVCNRDGTSAPFSLMFECELL